MIKLKMVSTNRPWYTRNKKYFVYGTILTLFILILTIVNQENFKNYYVLHKINFKVDFISEDYHRLINLDFKFKKLPLICDNKPDLLIILVHTATQNFDKRIVIRETWGKKESGVKILFMMGASEDNEIEEKIQEEHDQYNDLVQGNFVDTYQNLTYKHLMALKYTFYHCQSIPFILKVDDDVFVNIETLKKFLNAYSCQKKLPLKILCYILFTPPVLREGKWNVSIDEFPEEHYPNYCLGFAILYTNEVLSKIYSIAQNNKFFWIDDVYITGIVAKIGNISHIGIENLVLSGEQVHQIVDLSFTNITKPFLLGSINLDSEKISALSKFVSTHETKFSVLDYLNY